MIGNIAFCVEQHQTYPWVLIICNLRVIYKRISSKNWK